ncbi:bifunctional 4'-phosphopantothenoylcysteine decarboxylase/phosphopantothenoylcysteine synthetase [Gammaproteobacteria bacterium 42_54_T18]|nr:bifunctional 4'-phosphopantothenoylcysteine decarboxylase/phosphopantothenoylcysteine synthetase [Gammaproteobacteria bacterium 42_54_T18]
MQRLANKRIVLGVTGGIAAYKSAELIRRLIDAGAEIRVVMTKAAQEFITPLTLQALSGNPVHVALLDTEAEAGMGHIELARWGDALLIAPASADFIARLTHGHGNDLLTTLCLATRCPIHIAPAMNQGMWASTANQNNIQQLETNGIHLIGPGSGYQACGDIGLGRMSEPNDIAQILADSFQTGSLAGTQVVITAGPTREAIDPVRYISNHSSGKMGFALAEAARDAGAIVTLIAGPVNLATPDRVNRINVVSAEDMLVATTECLDTLAMNRNTSEASIPNTQNAIIFIGTAAVADYRPDTSATQKIKKTQGNPNLTLQLIENPDIIAAVAQRDPKPFTVGFAAETQNVLDYANDKITRKNLDMIVANDVSNKEIGFNSDLNAVTIIWPEGNKAIDVASKSIIASAIIQQISLQL